MLTAFACLTASLDLQARIVRSQVWCQVNGASHRSHVSAPSEWADVGPLAYVEWFSKLPQAADPIHMMYEVRKMPLRADGTPPGEIVPLSMIRQSCQLIPKFPRPTNSDMDSSYNLLPVPLDWNSHNVLDKANRFLLNNWATKYSYQTLW